MAGPGRITELMRTIHGDEARWCAMLRRQLRAIDAMPSRKVGSFYGKAMAIADLAGASPSSIADKIGSYERCCPAYVMIG